MSEKEQVFVEKFNELLIAAKEMKKEGNIIDTQLAITLTSNNEYVLERQKIIHAIDGCFINNEYRIIR